MTLTYVDNRYLLEAERKSWHQPYWDIRFLLTRGFSLTQFNAKNLLTTAKALPGVPVIFTYDRESGEPAFSRTY